MNAKRQGTTWSRRVVSPAAQFMTMDTVDIGPLTSSNGLFHFRDAAPAGNHRFYRVQSQP